MALSLVMVLSRKFASQRFGCVHKMAPKQQRGKGISGPLISNSSEHLSSSFLYLEGSSFNV